MNERFRELPEEKQQAIWNASMEVFAKHDYKRASTDLIAAKAGVSKGLLFYYFHNKKELYLKTYEYALYIIKKEVVDEKLLGITDFFELMIYAAKKKFLMLKRNPYVLEFSIRSFYSEKEEISDGLKAISTQGLNNSYTNYFCKLSLDKFKEGVDPEKIYKMLLWMTDGYLHERQMQGNTLEVTDLEKEFRGWAEILKSVAYREEFL